MNDEPVTCADFDAAVDELAVGAVGEPDRSALLAHAATCTSCAARLRELADVSDGMLLLAPSVEPPRGFESRALDRIGVGRTASRGSQLARMAGAAVVIVLALVTGVVVGASRDDGDHTVGHGTIVAAGDARLGTVQLVSEPSPHVLLTIDHPREAPGQRSCELELADGTRVMVGHWAYYDIEHGVWAAGIDERLLHAVHMRILDSEGHTIATAELES